MASPRRPTALGQAPGSKPAASGGGAPQMPARAPPSPEPELSLDGIDDERTTVEDQPPGGLRDRWEEQTVSERNAQQAAAPTGPPPSPGRLPTPSMPPPPPIAARVTARRAVSDEVRPTEAAGQIVRAEPEIQTLDEPTVEDQSRPPPLAVVPGGRPRPPEPGVPTRPAIAAARMMVTAGSDRGREFALVSPRTTIGRAIDNDIVLTDIAVSRHHLVILFDGQSYAMRDLGSGNGTLVNQRREDADFPLSNGDQIELGNTLFRFDCPEAPPIAVALPRASRGPEPIPLAQLGMPDDDDDELSTLAGRPPPPELAITAMPQPATLPAHAAYPRHTLPSAVPPPPLPPLPHQADDLGALFPSLASYSAPPARDPALSLLDYPHDLLAPRGMSSRQRRRLIVGLVLGTIGLVGVAVAAVMLGKDESHATSAATAASAGPEVGEIRVESHPASASAEPLAGGAAPTGATTTTSEPTMVAAPPPLAAQPPSPGPVVTPAAPPPAAVPPPPPEAVATTPAPAPAPVAAQPPPPTVEPRPEPTAPQPTVTALRPSPPAAPAREPKRPAPTPARVVATAPAHPDVRPAPARPAAPRPAPRNVAAATPKAPPRAVPQPVAVTRRAAVPAAPPAPKSRIPAAKANAARKRAETRYRAKDFAGAAAALREVAGEAEDPTAEELREAANSYEQVGAQIDAGNVNRSSNPPVALAAFRKALQLDGNVGGGVHATFLRTKLAEIAPKAAASYMVQNKFEAARKACDAAVNYGSGDDPMVGRVRKALDKKAGELYQQALAERKSDRKAADGKLRRVLAMVPAESGWYAKAYALLNAGDPSRSHDEDE